MCLDLIFSRLFEGHSDCCNFPLMCPLIKTGNPVSHYGTVLIRSVSSFPWTEILHHLIDSL